MVIVQRQPELLHVVATRHTSCRFASRLDRGQEQTDHNPDDGNYDQQFNKRKRIPVPFHGIHPKI
jgi:hypothetical protein